MSKSAAAPTGVLELLDAPAVNARKIRSAVTDTGREVRVAPDKPGVSNLVTILAALTSAGTDAVEAEFAGRGYGDLKAAVADAFQATFTPFRERTLALLDDPDHLAALLAEGAERATAVATQTLAAVYDRVGFVPRKA
jgi:tryptophanyl-tRNA synthetase